MKHYDFPVIISSIGVAICLGLIGLSLQVDNVNSSSDKNLFCIGLECIEELNMGKVPNQLSQEFATIETKFSQDAVITLKEAGKHWQIDDRDNKKVYEAGLRKDEIQILEKIKNFRKAPLYFLINMRNKAWIVMVIYLISVSFAFLSIICSGQRKGKPLFQTKLSYRDNLDKEILPILLWEEIRSAITSNSDIEEISVLVDEARIRWFVIDGENIYIAQKEDDVIGFYFHRRVAGIENLFYYAAIFASGCPTFYLAVIVSYYSVCYWISIRLM